MPPSAPGAWPLAGCLLLVLLSVAPSIQAPAGKEEAKTAQITSTLQLQATLGQKVRVACEGKTVYPESGIMYWLANNTFVDQLYPNGTVKEEATREKGSKLTRELVFSPLRTQDLHTEFKCFLTDPSGAFQEHIKWIHPKMKSSSD